MHQPPRAGDVVRVDGAASVQFAGPRAWWIQVTSVSQKPTYHGWCWLTGYALDQTTGEAVEKREIFVQVEGLRPVPVRAAVTGSRLARRPR